MSDTSGAMIDQDHLREMIEVISGELELRPLLTTIVQKACELLRADRGSIGLVDPSGPTVRIAAVYKMPENELGARSRPGEGVAGMVLRDRKPVLVARYGDVATRRLPDIDEDSVVGMPIMWRNEIIGTFGIGAAPPKRFGDNDMASLEVFARHAAIAINNARSHDRERKYAALSVRQQLAHDLHDNVSQLIFSMSMVAQSIGAGYAKSQQDGDSRVARLIDIAALAQKEMKSLLAELKGPADEREDNSLAAYARRAGLAAALARHTQLSAPEGARIEINVSTPDRLSPAQRETLLRISQEALANALRHGGARNVIFSLTPTKDGVCFRIADDGAGLDAKSEGGAAHLGLQSMRARAKAIRGELSIMNRPNGGVCVEVALPVA